METSSQYIGEEIVVSEYYLKEKNANNRLQELISDGIRAVKMKDYGFIVGLECKDCIENKKVSIFKQVWQVIGFKEVFNHE